MASHWLSCGDVQVRGAFLITSILPKDAEEVLAPCAFRHLDPLPEGTHDLLSWRGVFGELHGQEDMVDAVLLHMGSIQIRLHLCWWIFLACFQHTLLEEGTNCFRDFFSVLCPRGDQGSFKTVPAPFLQVLKNSLERTWGKFPVRFPTSLQKQSNCFVMQEKEAMAGVHWVANSRHLQRSLAITHGGASNQWNPKGLRVAFGASQEAFQRECVHMSLPGGSHGIGYETCTCTGDLQLGFQMRLGIGRMHPGIHNGIGKATCTWVSTGPKGSGK